MRIPPWHRSSIWRRERWRRNRRSRGADCRGGARATRIRAGRLRRRRRQRQFMAPFSQDEGLAFFRKISGSVASGDTVLLAAKLDGKIVGTVQLGLDTPPNQPHRADIKKMLVHRSARGHGIGAALMAWVEEEARRCGRWLLVLDTVPGDNGYRLYRRAGWGGNGSIPAYTLFSVGWGGGPALVFER